MERIILHCDLNNFFASVECKENPNIENKPVAVCGSEENRHGIVLAKNYIAKQYGIQTGDTCFAARQKCPDIVMVPPNFKSYLKYSQKTREIYYRFTDMVEPFGIDECWLDVTGSTLLFGSGEKIANTIKETVKSELGLMISAGVSFNKTFAKLGSDMKKPDAVTVITKENFREKIYKLSAAEMFGVGRKTNKKLNSVGIYTIGDIASCSCSYLSNLLGICGETLWRNVNGLDNSPVMHQDYISIPKSVGNSVTCRKDLTDPDEVKIALISLAEEVSKRLRNQKLKASTIQLLIKDNKLETKQIQEKVETPIRTTKELVDKSMEMFCSFYKWNRNIRALGIKAVNLVSDDFCGQLNFFNNDRYNGINEIIDSRVDGIRSRYGKDSIVRAVMMNNQIMPIIKNGSIYKDIF